MSVSEVIEDYIRRNPGVGEDAAFQGFLQQERIKAWVGSDETRRERLRREFRRVWGVMHAPPPATAPSQPQPPSPSPASAAAQPRQAALVREVKPEPPAARPPEARPAPPAPAPPSPARAPPPSPSSAPASAERPASARLQTGPPRRLQVLCATCARMDVWLQGGDIACRQCGRAYDDMLQLVPVKAVGPFAYLFGEGAGGWLTAGSMAAALLAIYALLRWL